MTQVDLFPATLPKPKVGKEPCPYSIERVCKWSKRGSRRTVLYFRIKLCGQVVNTFLTKKAAKAWIDRRMREARGIHPSWLP